MKQIFVALCALIISVGAHAAKPTVELNTNKGTIIIELYPDKAPKTVANFLEYVNSGYYDGTIFHRVIPDFMVQGGGYTQSYEKKPTKNPVENEANNGLQNRSGTVAMARTNDPHSATSQFFINVANNAFLNYRAPTARGYGYTVFGTVIKGMTVIHQISKAPTGSGGGFSQDVPQDMVIIKQARVVGESQ